MAVRESLAAVLGIALGLFLVAYPDAFLRIQTVGRVPGNRRGEYGEDQSFPRTWRLLVRAAGLLVVAIGLFFAWQVLL